LHVVQVAHHAGHNAHFYRCLLASDFAAHTEHSYLLLSHGTDDKHRPSGVFGQFVEAIRKESDKVRLLFTSRPREEKVRDFKAMFGPLTDPPQSSGDVRLVYDENGWKVVAHVIAAP
jgi:hypothetical protein